MQNRKAFHSSLNNKTIQVLQSLASKQGINQGRVIDYLVQLYLDQLVRDNDDILQAVKVQFEADRATVKDMRRNHMLSIRRNATQPAATPGPDDNPAGIF